MSGKLFAKDPRGLEATIPYSSGDLEVRYQDTRGGVEKHATLTLNRKASGQDILGVYRILENFDLIYNLKINKIVVVAPDVDEDAKKISGVNSIGWLQKIDYGTGLKIIDIGPYNKSLPIKVVELK